MENAAEALKMAFAVLVFVIAMTIGFVMISQAKATADVVFQAKDKQDYVDTITAVRQNTDGEARTVGLDTIIPTIFRYTQENYGVTIIDDHDIVALYDLQVERTVSSTSAYWNAPTSSEKDTFEKLCMGEDKTGTTISEPTEDNPSPYVGIRNYINGVVPEEKKLTWDVERFKTFFRVRYHIDGYTNPRCPWTSADYHIIPRLKADIEGTTVTFGDNTYNGFRLLAYANDTFKEYYFQTKKFNPLTEEVENDKLQIIYVKD